MSNIFPASSKHIRASMKNLSINTKIALGIFDFDGNILAPTLFEYYYEKENSENVRRFSIEKYKQSQYLQKKYLPLENADIRFSHQSDFPVPFIRYNGVEQLLSDVHKAIKQKKISPSFDRFKTDFLIPARFFALITARGNTADNLARAIMLINDRLLSQKEKQQQGKNIYLLYQVFYPHHTKKPSSEELLHFYFHDVVYYYPVGNKHVAKQFFPQFFLPKYRPTLEAPLKVAALRHYLTSIRILLPEIFQTSLSHTHFTLGFSDDSFKNILAVMRFFLEEKNNKHPLIRPTDKIRIYFSGKKEEILPAIKESGVFSYDHFLKNIPVKIQKNMCIFTLQ